MRGFIYCLKDNEGNPFYVGSTIHPELRLKAHISCKKQRKAFPLYEYMAKHDIMPVMEILECKSYRSKATFLDAEVKWIKYLEKQGFILTNVSSRKGLPRKVEPGTIKSCSIKLNASLLAKTKVIALKLRMSLSHYVTLAVKEKNKREK